MKKYIVITTINEPSEAILRFREWPDWHVVVVGDRKSPVGWHCDGVTYLDIDEQNRRFGALAKLIPENSYKRKILGYVHAIEAGANVILETDDDNIPYPHARDAVEADLVAPNDGYSLVSTTTGWLNAYREFGVPRCWPRGYPLEHISRNEEPVYSVTGQGPRWGVLQYLANDDPDVDAIFRLTRAEGAIRFTDKHGIRLARGTCGPFNSQATVWVRDTFPLLFLPLGVTDRITDILRGYIAVPCLWQVGQTLAYASPIVHQIRNEHNLLRDFEQEIDLYRYASKWCRQLQGAVYGTNSLTDAFETSLETLIEGNVITKDNLEAYRLFLQCIR